MIQPTFFDDGITNAPIAVPLNEHDIIGKTAIEKRVDAIRKQTRRSRIKVSRTKMANLTARGASKTNDGVFHD